MLQNRVDPFGNIIKTKARGAWMGNRGYLHNRDKEILRPFKVNAWLTCRLEFKGRKREIMAPGKYTELFFLDEATACSAGHRPCSECRREDHLKFKQLWIKANPEYGFNEKTPIGEIDEILQGERINADKSKRIHEQNGIAIPDGTFVLINDKPCLVFKGLGYLGHRSAIPIA